MKLAVIAGIPGSGSTTVLNKVLEEVDYVHLNYGDIMLKIAKENKLVEHRDEIRKLPSQDQKIIQQEAAKYIKEESKDKNVIVDTHCTISTPTGFLPGLPKWVLEDLKPTLFLLVEADDDEILLRRITDVTRARDMELTSEIGLHQEMNRAAAIAYATLTGATVKIVQNHNDVLDETVKEVVDVLNY